MNFETQKKTNTIRDTSEEDEIVCRVNEHASDARRAGHDRNIEGNK